MIRTKRWNDPIATDDGYRLLVTRYRPRGVPREGEPWEAWLPQLAPSKELHAAAYGKHGQAALPWESYRTRYLEEMRAQSFWIEAFAGRARASGALTLLCSSACVDEARCHRSLLRELMLATPDPSAPPPPPCAASPVRRRPRT